MERAYNVLSYGDVDTALSLLENNESIVAAMQVLDDKIDTTVDFPQQQQLKQSMQATIAWHEKITPLLQKYTGWQQKELNQVEYKRQLSQHLKQKKP